ncbi:MAG: carbohydrate kinase [Actinobacteria bacterium]|nr:carbohydrate kinase [Actinomycetota bacterium]
MIALLGNLSRDVLPGQAARPGGAPYHGARALRHLRIPAEIHARCAVADRASLYAPLVHLGTPARYVPGTATAGFEFSYDGDERRMRVTSVGDTWRPSDLPALDGSARWVHVAPLLRSDFPAETLARLARGRRILFDGQGLVRVPRVGDLELDDAYDPAVLRHVWALKLADEEAAVLGDLHALQVREVLVTHGSRGVTLYVDGRVEEVAAFPVDGDPTGAGDAFCVGYAAARDAGHPPLSAARRAVALVAEVLAGE